MVDLVGNLLRRLSSAYHHRSVTSQFRPQAAPEHTAGGPRVLFVPFYTDPLFLVRETFMAKSVEWRGAETALLYCDREIIPTERGYLKSKLGFAHPVFSGGKRLLDHLLQCGLPISNYYRSGASAQAVPFDPLTANPKVISAHTYRGIPLGDLVVSSSVRIQLSMGPEWENPVYRQLVKDLLATAAELVDTFFAAFADYRPDRIVLSHAIYLSWGIAFRVARYLNIPTLVYNGSYRINTLRMYANVPNAPFPEAEWPRFRDQKLATAEKEWTDQYLKGRLELEGEAHDLFGTSTSSDGLQEFIRRARTDGKPLAALFTNMSWDAFAFSGSGPFESMVEWANATLSFARDHPDLRLIFKIHPGEVYWKVPERYRIRRHLIDIPSNVFVLWETDRVKPAAFYPHLDFGIINISTVAIEMAFLGIPVLSSGAGGHYDHRGFTLAPTDREEYLDHLARLTAGTHDFSPDSQQLQRYVFYRFYREAVPFEPLSMRAYQIEEININTYDDLQPGKLAGVDTLADAILAGRTAVRSLPDPQ